MWKSEDDILKDLALLNDFGDKETCKILYSNGRGKHVKHRNKSPEKFIDPRTGEIIDVSNSEFQNGDFCKGKGRGRHFASFSLKKFQLQEQLRMARPLGSGDEAIESFCNRNRSRGNSTNTSDSDADSQNPRLDSQCSNSKKPVTRVKGSRNSGLQNNVLINSLLFKAKDVEVVSDKKSFSTDDDNSKSNTNDRSNIDCSKISDNNSFTGGKRENYITIVEETEEEADGDRKKKSKARNESHSELCVDSKVRNENSSDKTINPCVENENGIEVMRETEICEQKWVNSGKSVKSYCITSDKDFPPLKFSSMKKY